MHNAAAQYSPVLVYYRIAGNFGGSGNFGEFGETFGESSPIRQKFKTIRQNFLTRQNYPLYGSVSNLRPFSPVSSCNCCRSRSPPHFGSQANKVQRPRLILLKVITLQVWN